MKPFIWALNLASLIRAIPAAWDPVNYCIVLKCGQSYGIPFCHLRTPRRGYILAGIYLLIEVLNILYLLFFLLFLEHSNMDLYISSILLAGFIFSTFVQLLLVFFNFEKFVHVMNAFLFLDLEIRKQKKRKMVYSSKLIIVLKSSVTCTTCNL